MSWVELRVHGVSGAPPDSLLGVPHVDQVAGDEYSRFFRPVDDAARGHVLEGYHWGRFTSGTWRQALGLLLVPFGLVNAAQFMLPKPQPGLGALMHLLAGACLRVLALVLTALFAFTLGLIFIDIGAWRWAPTSDLLANQPSGRVVAAAALAAALVFAGLALLGRSGDTRKPEAPAGDETPTSTALDPDFFAGDPDAPTMRMLHMAGGIAVIALLLALAREGSALPPVAFLAAVTLAVILAGDPERTVTIGIRAGAQWQRRRKILAGVLLGASVVLLTVQARAARRELPDLPVPGRPTLTELDPVADWLMVCAVVALGLLHAANVFLVWRGPGHRNWTRRDATIRLRLAMPGLLVGVLILLVGPPALLAIAAAVVVAISAGLALWALRWALAPDPDGEHDHDAFFFRPYAGGMTPFLLATLSTFIAVGLSAAAANAIAATIPGTNTTTDMLDRVGYAWGLTMAVVIALALLGAVRVHRLSRGFEPRVKEDFADGEETVLPEDWHGRVARARAVAQLKNDLPYPVIAFVAVGLLISGVLVIETFESLGNVASWLGWVSEPRDSPTDRAVIAVGSWVLVAAAGYLVAVSRGAIRNNELRRGINVVWDVFSFWPHAVHPFVPRPYSRWTVIELRNRIRLHLGGAGAGAPAPEKAPDERKVVVAAHSQGSLIAYAALLLLEPYELKRVAFLSCGSQLRVIYPRAFPAYVNLATHRELFALLDEAWINLYRSTDPLAGPVLSWDHEAGGSRHLPPAAPDVVGADRCRRSGNDWGLIDPVPHDVHVELGAVAAVHGHHDFWGDPAWTLALTKLRARP